MANEEQLAILRQGVKAWNKWREENPNVNIDLAEINLNGANLVRANLIGALLNEAKLVEANLFQTDLGRANLRKANLNLAILSGANLGGANLHEANLLRAHLSDAIISGATLNGANLREAQLRNADLSEAKLFGTNLRSANFIGSNFSKAIMGETILENLDLSPAIGLNHVEHFGPSIISMDTFVRSKGNIPDVFLRGCGLSDWEIESVKLYNPDLSNDEFIDIQNRIFDLRQRQALQISPLFISYNHADGMFVDKLEGRLNNTGIRFWRDVHDATAGRLEKVVDRAMRLNPIVLLILSEHSLKSDWVEHEVRTARQLERDMGRDVLCPVALDDSWKNSPWPKRVMEQVMEYNILDFSEWKDDGKFGNTFNKLIDGLGLFYEG